MRPLCTLSDFFLMYRSRFASFTATLCLLLARPEIGCGGCFSVGCAAPATTLRWVAVEAPDRRDIERCSGAEGRTSLPRVPAAATLGVAQLAALSSAAAAAECRGSGAPAPLPCCSSGGMPDMRPQLPGGPLPAGHSGKRCCERCGAGGTAPPPSIRTATSPSGAPA